MEDLLMWGLVLLGAGVLMLLAEMFLPTGGLLGILAGLCAAAGIIILFKHDTTWGFTALLCVLILGPMAAGFLVKVWPHTPIGRAIFGTPSEDEVQKQRLSEEAERETWLALVGKEGLVLSDLRPVGIVEIDGRRYDALCETTLIRAGQKVRVTSVESRQVKVRPVA
jgi:membrane-bound ClpP family serine protease